MINCTYETSNPSPYLFWYQQKMNGIPKYMIMIFATTVQRDKDFEDRFKPNHNKTSKSVPLTIQNLRVSDSAVYFCALRPTVTETHSTLIQKLMALSYTDDICYKGLSATCICISMNTVTGSFH